MAWITINGSTRQALQTFFGQERKGAVVDPSTERRLPDGQWEVKLEPRTVVWLLDHAFPGETIEDTIIRLLGGMRHTQ
jgi:hypothetical protein